jgi:hypothetical protein
MADGRLAQVQVPRRTRDAAMLENSVHHAEQIEVKSGRRKGHGAFLHDNNDLPISELFGAHHLGHTASVTAPPADWRIGLY